MYRELFPALRVFVLLTLLTGVVYPLIVTGAAAVFFPYQAGGSIIEVDGRKVGSELIGQAFDEPRYFWGRPSATSPAPYNAMSGGGSNLAPTNPALVDAVGARVAKLRAADPDNSTPVPIDLVTASASGLDPHISPAAAYFQVARVARVRGLSDQAVRGLVDRHIVGPTWGVFGAARVAVLPLNRALDTLKP